MPESRFRKLTTKHDAAIGPQGESFATVRGKNIPQRKSPAQVLPFPGVNAPNEMG